MALKLTTSKPDMPQAGDTLYVYYANSSIKMLGLTDPNGNNQPISNPFTVPSSSEWYGFEPPVAERIDVWWQEEGKYIVKDLNVSNPDSLENPFPQYVLSSEESDPIFTAWDKREGIEITLSQVTDWVDHQEPLESGVNIKTINGQSVLGEGDMTIYDDTVVETDPIFTAWDKSTGISVTESQISDFGNYQGSLLSTYNIKTINGQSILGYGNLSIGADEVDPYFEAWDRTTGIAIYESQIIDLYPTQNIDLMEEEGEEDLYVEDGVSDLALSGVYQVELVNEENIKTLNGISLLGNGNIDTTGIEGILEETDPIFTAWDKSTGITIYKDQIIDFRNYQVELVSGTNIKTINGESILGSGNIEVPFPDFVEVDPYFSNWNKSTGITIYESQISDLGDYQEELVSGENIKTINGQSVVGSGDIVISFEEGTETDPIFTAWNKSTGITIYESQISDLGDYQDELVSGTNIKTINGQSVLGTGVTYIYGDEVTGTEVIDGINSVLGGTEWQSGVNSSDAFVGDVVGTHINVTDNKWLLCDGSVVSAQTYPDLANLMTPATITGDSDQLYVWGYNDKRQLGIGSVDISVPTAIDSGNDWASFDGGERHSVAIKTDGTLWTWGYNGYGQLGYYSAEYEVSSPTQVGSLTDWQSISSGERFNAAIKTDGTLWSWGDNRYGQLGLGDTTNYSSPVQVGSLTDWASVSCGRGHTLAIKTDGTLWSWGRNDKGQLGQGDFIVKSSPVQVGSHTDWEQVSGGGYFSFALKTDGTLWGWGDNDSGQLGLGNRTNKNLPEQVRTNINWTRVELGWNHTTAIDDIGRIYTWGLNNYGQLGLGDIDNRYSPVLMGGLSDWVDISCGGYYYTIAIRSSGTMWSWGLGSYGQLGAGATAAQSTPVQIGSLNSWEKINCGYRHAAAISMGTVEEFYLPNYTPFDRESWYIRAIQ